MKTAPDPKKDSDKSFRIGIVCANFNPTITGKMLDYAIAHAKKENFVIEKVLEVPGCLETPLATKKLLQNPLIDSVVVVGAIVKGATKHDKIIGHAVCRALVELSLHFEKPVGMGITGPGQTRQQAIERIEEYPRRAVLAVKQMLLLK